MSVSIGNFRKNVAKTISAKAAKLGLKTLVKNTQAVNIAHVGADLTRNVGNLLQSQEQNILGFQVTQEDKDKAAFFLGDVGASVVALAKVLKVKTPSSASKKKLVGTRASNLLQLHSLATDLFFFAEELMFATPPTTKVNKDVKNPSTGVVTNREVSVVDEAANKVVQAANEASIKSALESIIPLYWGLCYDITGNAPSLVMASKLERMKTEHPEIAFEKDSEPVEAITEPVAV